MVLEPTDPGDITSGSLVPCSETKCKGLPRGKRRRQRKDNNHATSTTASTKSLFTALPFELLAEILMFTTSSRDVLSVARCSKYLCTTLLHPSSSFIWATVRKICTAPPPEPMEIFTEASYAAFLFDDGVCEMCGKKTNALYASFGIRLRLCPSVTCRSDWVLHGDCVDPRDPQFQSEIALPHIESTSCLAPGHAGHSRGGWCRKSYYSPGWQGFGQNFNPTSRSPESDKKMDAFVIKYMGFCYALHHWKELRQEKHKLIMKENNTFAKKIADSNGLEYWDMLNSTSYGDLHRLKNRRLEFVTQQDYEPIAADIFKRLRDLSERRRISYLEVSYAENRQDVSKYHQILRSQHSFEVLPSLQVFRKLPVILQLQGSAPNTSTCEAIMRLLKTEKWVRDRLEIELKQWTEMARKGLCAVLGYSEWNPLSSELVHPVDRVTARFRCKFCSKVAFRYMEDDCLDFSGACAHQCPGMKRDTKLNGVWTAENFVKDEKAISVLIELLALCKVDASHEDAAPALSNIGDVILCKSCPSGLVLNSRSIVGHSHRHPHMEMALLSKEDADRYSKYPPCTSLVRSLSGPERRVKALRKKMTYGCRHCHNAQAVSRRSADQNGTGMTGREGDNDVRFSFEGLCSHLGGKHSIYTVRDEDVFTFEHMVL